MNVVLIYPAWTKEYGILKYFARRSSIVPPLGLALLGAIAEQQGHQVTIIDGESLGLTKEEIVEKVMQLSPDIIGITVTTPYFGLVRELAESLKMENPDISIVVGGPHVTIVKEEIMDYSFFDYAFLGEAEYSFPQFLNKMDAGEDISDVKGIIYRREDKVFSSGMPDPIKNIQSSGYPLDQFPFSAFHLLPMEKYKVGTPLGQINCATIMTTRGCPWECIFCASDDLNTTRVIRRSPRNVVDEIKMIIEKYNIHHFIFLDQEITLSRKYIIAICDLLDKENLKITFEGGTRADLVDEPLIARMVASGLIRLGFGLEAVDDEIREIMGKKVDLDRYITANRICHKYNVEVLNSVMIGLPGETRETIQKTIDFLINNHDVVQVNFAIAMPYPGTKFHQMALDGEYGLRLLSKDYSKYRRYNSAVTQVNDLTPDDLLDIQNECYVKIYTVPWRWKALFKRQGLMGVFLTFSRIIKIWQRKFIKHLKPLSYNSVPS